MMVSSAKVAARCRVREGSVKNFVTPWRETATIEPTPVEWQHLSD